MNIQEAFNALAGVSLVCLGWFAREMWTAMKVLKDDLAKLREELPKTYIPKSDLERIFERIDRKLDEIRDKLERKVDR